MIEKENIDHSTHNRHNIIDERNFRKINRFNGLKRQRK